MKQIENFRQGLKFVLKHEVGNKPNGGYTNDPDDPGGETKWGISKRFHPTLDIRNLTPDQAANIYASEYWDACGCDSLSFPLCVVVFDTAVNPGVGRALNWLKIATDVNNFLFLRKMYYVSLVKANPKDQKYLAGWLNRVADLQKFVEVSAASMPDTDVTQLPDWHF